MNKELILISVASDGSVEQWDGLNTPKGILLRWFHGSLGFPELGYDVFRAKITDPAGLDWARLADGMNGRESYKTADGLVITCPEGFQFAGYQGRPGLKITLKNPVTFIFPDPAWYLSLQTAPVQGSHNITVNLFVSGKVRETLYLDSVNPGAVCRTRGIDRVELSGEGICTVFSYQLISSIAGWQLIWHACLPVTDPAYAGGSGWSGSDEDEARRRLPPKADWSGRYGPAFKELYTYLKSIAAGKPLPELPPAAQTGVEAPSLNLTVPEAIETAMLNPHVARMLGTAWDDPLGGSLDGDAYAYKVVGAWKGALHRWLFRSPKVLSVLRENGIDITVPTVLFPIGRSGWEISLPARGAIEITVKKPCEHLSIVLSSARDLNWQTLDAKGRLLDRGVFPATKKYAELKVKGYRLHRLQLLGPAEIRLTQLRLQNLPVERTALLPCVIAQEPGAPSGPGLLYPEVVQAGNAVRSLEARLHWDLPLSRSGAVSETGPVFYQVAGVQVGDDPEQPAQQPPQFNNNFFLHKDQLLMVPPQAAAADYPCFFIDRPLSEGWRCWWVRGVDLFGRVSVFSAPEIAQIVDNALPPAPSILLAEYVQDSLAASQQSLTGYSEFGQAWLAANPGGQAVVVGWGWTPELALEWPDVDCFQVHVRRPQTIQFPEPNGPIAAYPEDPSSWGPDRAQLAPVAARLDGRIRDVFNGIPQVALTTFEVADEAHTVYQTDISLDLGRGALLGAVVRAAHGGTEGIIAGHGEGPRILITLEHPENQSPNNGTYSIARGDGKLFTVETDIVPGPLDQDPFHRRISGVLIKGDQRWAVLRQDSGRFLCLGDIPPVSGDGIAWLPAYLMAIPDNNFGPDPKGTGLPVAYAQVAVRSVRHWKQRPLFSEFSRPGTLSAVDCAQPSPPEVEYLPCGPFCAQLATRADWYGISRFTLSWETRPGETYQVYRALGEAIYALDRQAHGAGAHPFPNDPGGVWPVGIYSEIIAEADRKAIVQEDFNLLDAALHSGSDEAIRITYRKLHADTQRLLAGQACVESAYSLRHGHPLTAGQVPFTDEFDGRSRAHWFYRVTALSHSGVESHKTEPTPPICCPDVVPPAPPTAHMALAGEGVVKLHWLPSSAEDLNCYLIYRADGEDAATDIRSMFQVARITKDPTVPGAVDEKPPAWVTDQGGNVVTPRRLEYCDPAPPGKEWFYRIVAEDSSGNRSQPSIILRGRALLAPPAPPVWNPPARVPETNPVKIQLSWTHPTDQRLACLVERRVAGGSLWIGVSSWLPRSVYNFKDTPPDITLAWEYRLRVRNHGGQQASEMPVVLLNAL
ncbi:MAG: hypothetical protein JL50_08235 [Peptococcaceae bacterium BICA1-7]|nr:MAG: hypothetical protein JL50_08235 [Peptococcaceae bacterium BICA1-7]HBV97451.1 hypothetical protein [Desulfotomaculum sp.]